MKEVIEWQGCFDWRLERVGIIWDKAEEREW